MFASRPEGDPAALAARLWSLAEWNRRAGDLLAGFAGATDPPLRLAAAAALVRHLAADPLLPAALLPADWAGERLRTVYAEYVEELRALTR